MPSVWIVRTGGPEESTDLRIFSSPRLAFEFIEICWKECPWIKDAPETDEYGNCPLGWLEVVQMELDGPMELLTRDITSLHYHLDIEKPEDKFEENN
jgi:hypothetical protein